MTILLTAIAMLAFAANSLLARAALADGGISAVAFTTIRLGAGAAILSLILVWQHRAQAIRLRSGNWISALCLLTYALCFSFAYLRLGAALGAVILFAAVQARMITIGMVAGHHPNRQELAGLVIASAAFVWLMLPGLHAPNPLGASAMVLSGCSWGVYSLRGRGRGDPSAETGGNFVRAALISLPIALVAGAMGTLGPILPDKFAIALTSGAITSGLGYIIWYHAMPRLTPLQASTVQLTVPIIAALGAVVFLSETLTLRLALAGTAILGGVALTILARRPG